MGKCGCTPEIKKNNGECVYTNCKSKGSLEKTPTDSRSSLVPGYVESLENSFVSYDDALFKIFNSVCDREITTHEMGQLVITAYKKFIY